MIRPMNRHDLADIVELYNEVRPFQSVSVQTIAPILDHYLISDSYEVFCYESDRIEAFVTVSKRWTFFPKGRTATIEDIVVRESLRGKGMRRELIHFVELRMKEQGIMQVECSLENQEDRNKDLWEALQYEPSGIRFRKQVR